MYIMTSRPGHVFRPGPVWGCDRLVFRAKVIENQVVYTRIITPALPVYSLASDLESDPFEDPSSDHIPPLSATSPFLSSDYDTTDRDTLDTPPSPTHAPGQPIPHGRPYRYHLNGSAHMMTARKRVGPLPTHRLAVRYYADHSSSDSSSEASSDFHSDASSDSSSGHSLSDHSSPDLPSTSARPSRKRRQSHMTYVPALPLVSGALSPVRADLIPSPKRVRDSGYSADVEVDPRETSLRDDVIAESDECFAYGDALRDRGIDARVVVEARIFLSLLRREQFMYEILGGLVQRFHDHIEAIPVHRIQVIKGVRRDQGHRIVGVESAVTVLTKRIAELERDNKRPIGTASVESQRVDRLQRGMSRENGGNGNEGNRGNGNRGNGGNRNGGNGGNGNGGNGENRNHGINYGGFMPVARECTFQDFLKCKPHNFLGTEGIVGLTRWFKKMETVFNISNCPPKYQVKYATCKLQDSALTWWNSHKRTIGVDAAYALKWAGLMKLMTKVYCPRNEIQKMETELMVSDEEDRVERFIGGLPDNIQGNMIAANPARL
ncbi:hypothetical protein Tco_1048878, partial [Tanacetum coccineum]